MEFYDLNEIVMLRRIAIASYFDDEFAKIHYEGDDGSEILFIVHQDVADVLVQMWNEAIEEDEQLSDAIAYKQVCIDAAQKELDRAEDACKELKRRLKSAYDSYQELHDAARLVLDSRAYDDDDSEMRNLRKLLWNENDHEQRIEAEGFDKSEIGCDDLIDKEVEDFDETGNGTDSSGG